jgi:hypothetical protein
MRVLQRTEHARRRVVGAALAVAAALGLLTSAPNTASAEPCDGADCVTHMRTGAVAGAPCAAQRLYALGLGASGGAFICYATYRNPVTAAWTPLPPLVGIRDFGALCSAPGSAQSSDGLPLVCRDGTWERYTPALPVS